LLGMTRTAGAIALIALLIAAIAMGTVPREFSFNGSISYFPCLLTILLLYWRLSLLKHPAAPYFLKASVWFGVSLTFRSIDFLVCPWLPIGTHFLWHGLNAIVLYTLTRALFLRTP